MRYGEKFSCHAHRLETYLRKLGNDLELLEEASDASTDSEGVVLEDDISGRRLITRKTKLMIDTHMF